MDEINILAASAAAAPNHCDGDSPVVCILGVSSVQTFSGIISMACGHQSELTMLILLMPMVSILS